MKFSSNENLQFYEKLIRKLVTSKQLLLKKENGEYCLTDNEYERITRLNEKINLMKKYLLQKSALYF